MKFVDEGKILVEAGKGGDGCVSFRREKFVPHGGPDGGDGGKGGSVYLIGDHHKWSLVDFSYRRTYRAGRGAHGRGKNMTGKDGEDIIIPVPLGTDVYDDHSRIPLAEIVKDGQKTVVARGGRGGRGNTHFKTSVHQTPEENEPGEQGERKNIVLKLRLLADLGIVGLPNAGKSTLLSKLTAALPRIAAYPFTTLTPNLGVAQTKTRTIVIADLPGLIEGAHEGKGLGMRFLRHIERVSFLIFLIDITSTDPAKDFKALVDEIDHYNPVILKKKRLVVFNKVDLLKKKAAVELPGEKVVYISALKETNLDLLRGAIATQFD